MQMNWGFEDNLQVINKFEVTHRDGLYIINDEENPTLTFGRGLSYSFNLDVEGHPFWIKTERSTGQEGEYNKGVTNNGAQTGVLSFDVPMDAPDLLYYNCAIHDTMYGEIRIMDEKDLKIANLVQKYKVKK